MDPAGPVTLRARYLWVSPGRCHAPGELVIDPTRGRVLRAGPCRRRGAPDRALLPGLVNAHVHLQLAPLPQPVGDFVPWIRAVLGQRAAAEGEDHEQRAEAALRSLLADGVTAVGEVDSTGRSPTALRHLPLAGRCYQELTGFDLDSRGAADLLRRRHRPGTRACPAGLSPHAPYSVSAELFRAALAGRIPLAVHVAETVEEQEFLRSGTGAFAELLADLGKLPPGFRPPGAGAVAYLQRLGVLERRTTLIHCQHLEAGDIERIARAGATIAVCPGTARYFGREPPPVPRWLSAGIPVALGTDSRASNETLSLRAEMARARTDWPELAPEQVLRMATIHGSRALHRSGLGRLAAGSRADFLELPGLGSGPSELLEAFTWGELEPTAVWLGGRRHAPEGPGAS